MGDILTNQILTFHFSSDLDAFWSANAFWVSEYARVVMGDTETKSVLPVTFIFH
jgi:hypothetical protein